MKPNAIHSIVVCLAAFALPFMVACSSREEPLPEVAEAALHLSIEPIGQTRAGLAALPDNEKMKCVRIVILHPDGTVEHNEFYPLGDAVARMDILLRVTPGEKKQIFLFANEKSVARVEGVTGEAQTLNDLFNGYTEGMPGFADAVKELYFAPDYSGGKPIPMSSVYETEVPEKGVVKETFYVVRVATKFTMNFKNWRGEEVTVNGFTVKSHADKNFLMAHVSDSEQNRQLFNGKTWIEWLKEVSDASSEDDDAAATEAAGWLKDYELPTQADKTKTYTYPLHVTVGVPTVDIDDPANSKPGVAKEPPVFYLPESINLKADAADGEQEYTLTLDIDGRAEPFVCTLPNLKALFRNTSVVVDISLYNSMEIVVDVIPYSDVTLDPVFGL